MLLKALNTSAERYIFPALPILNTFSTLKLMTQTFPSRSRSLYLVVGMELEYESGFGQGSSSRLK